MKMSKKFERVFSVLIAFVLAFGIVANTANLEAYAAGKNYGKFSTLDSITEDATLFKIIKSGKISAVYDSGWYYKFSNSSGSVMIKVSAFTSSPKNTNLAKDNQAINDVVDGVNDWKTTTDRICYYYKRTTSSKTDSGSKSYKTTMYRLYLRFSAANDTIKLKTQLKDGVTFTYNAKVPVTTTTYKQTRVNGKTVKTACTKTTYKEPSTASQYVAALTRSTTIDAITPTMELAVNNNNTGDMYLSYYGVAGVGNANTKVSIGTLMSVVTSAVSTTKNVASAITLPTPGSVYSALSSLYGTASTLCSLKYNKSSKQYNTGETNPLTYTKKGKKNCVLRAELTSPIKLSNANDWVEYTFTTANANEISNTTGVTLAVQYAIETANFCPVSLT